MTCPNIDISRVQTPVGAKPFHIWHMPDGAVWTEFYRIATGYLIRFPGYSDFTVSLDGRTITASPSPGIEPSTVDHLYLNQILPLALSKSGKLVFHASAVDIGGAAAAFLAETGRGKSTLAAAFAVSGHRFLTDDGLLVEAEESGYRVMPSHPSIRLWHDSHERLLPSDAPTAAPVSYTPKARLLAGSHLNYCSEPKPLRVAYFLGPGDAAKVVLSRLSPAESLIEWAKNSFLLDVEDQELIAAHFERLTSLANRIPCFCLDYPRNFEDLPDVLDAVTAHTSRLEFI